jgi:antitoxin MazE
MQIAKWGNSLAIRLPKKLVSELKLKAGDDISIVAAAEGQMTITPDKKVGDAVARMAARSWKLPENYRFDRDEANAR